MLTAIGYAADVAILGTYWWLARTGRVRPFHWANAVGCVPLLALEIPLHLWPVVIITLTFGVLGWFGLFVEAKAVRDDQRRARLEVYRARRILETAVDVAAHCGISLEQATHQLDRILNTFP